MKRRAFEIVSDQTGKIFDANVFTIVWSRRFAGYKRAGLIASDRERFEALLETIETLANPQAMKAIRKFQAGKMRFKSLAETKRELNDGSHF